ncbi:gamma-glutamyl-gamma-aminobutyrate hydrolase family protein [Oenococcus sicerae]|uniref:Gamma-glutamyl-gamma-aminobutyrate hydrolase family protein n=1 Tax=Oenococcus sicerae TaxID=2203724 RepID=A0AAJ1R8N0_9LACO|nr:gamma-glutamyl-gamma-aminobutyrate hydrolase family protein [Oenococcus sicerae]MDN6899776.1 gamma-glutamyl-gamma-aminobutyrate hydrolase family protein [Oenococcus sicerae]QAS70464.1 gamma-glutamyl-gamma-aminobutyrate hydrolase family protein [Oenococcus sicerae]VDK14996.1 Putative glutamine amidotransferase [Oenococcus sicerae]
MKKPIIAITADIYRLKSMSSNDQAIDYAPRDIIRAVYQVGGIPIVLPAPTDIKETDFNELTENFDGLLIPGGPDVDPSFFNEDPIPQLGGVFYERDQFEIHLISAAVKTGKAIFGICRGIQAINVALGGNLYQDLAAQYPDLKIKHRQYPTEGSFPTHQVTITEGSELAKIIGRQSFVNSRHHQAVKDLGKGLKVTAMASDGVIEGIGSSDSNQIVAVQWHPESMWQRFPEQLKLFKNFVERAEDIYD